MPFIVAKFLVAFRQIQSAVGNFYSGIESAYIISDHEAYDQFIS